jgi:hypothetical protein
MAASNAGRVSVLAARAAVHLLTATAWRDPRGRRNRHDLSSFPSDPRSGAMPAQAVPHQRFPTPWKGSAPRLRRAGPAMTSVLIEHSPTWLINQTSHATSQARDCWLQEPAERRWPFFAPPADRRWSLRFYLGEKMVDGGDHLCQFVVGGDEWWGGSRSSELCWPRKYSRVSERHGRSSR